ncbi:MAG TPA: MFS transporter [Candidatus Dormibacteraeota bacterium]
MARPSRSPLLPTEALTGGTAAPAAGVAAVPGGVRRLAVAGAAVLLAAADTYVVVLALPSIMRDVGLSLDQLQQAAPIVSGFLCGYVVVLPLLGRLSDLYGRRPVLLGCLAVFALGSAVTASAHGLGAVVAGRTLQGLGGGGLVPVTLALVADTWPPQHRGVPLGVVGAVQELGSVIGPLYGAAIVAVSGWRTIFWVNLPVAVVLAAGFRPPWSEVARRRAARGTGRVDLAGGALLAGAAAAALLALLQPDVLTGSDTLGQLYSPLLGASALTTPLALAAAGLLAALAAWELAAPWGVRPLLPLRRTPAMLRAADWPGALLLAAVLGCVIVAFAGADPSRQVVGDAAPGLLAAAAVAGVLFLLVELRRDDPLVPLAALRPRAAHGALLVNLCAGAALMAVLIDVPIFARATRFHDSQVQAALVLLRFLAAVPVGAVLGGLVCERLSHRVTAGCGMLLSAAMLLLLGGWTAGTLGEHAVLLGWHAPFGGADVELALCGLGFGLAIAPVNAAVLGAVRDSLHGLVSALVVVARMVGMLVGLAALTAVGLRRFYAASAQLPSPIRLCPQTPAHCPAYDLLATAAVVDELHAVFVGAALCAAAAAVLALVLLQRTAGAPGVSLGEVLAGG